MTVAAVERAPQPRWAWPHIWRHQGWLVVPLILFYVAFFVVPVGLLLATAFNPPLVGAVHPSAHFTLENFARFLSRSSFSMAAVRSVLLGSVVSFVTLIAAYPIAFVIAKTKHPARITALTILVLVPMQVDMVIRLYGLMVILGDNGLVNEFLMWTGLIGHPLALMYNFLGVVLGLVEFSMPFMILSLVGVIRNIDPSLEEAARSLGATRWKAFFLVTLPMSMPGILAGTLLVFALSISSYIVPALMGGFRVGVLPILIFQQVGEMARFQSGSAIAVILLVISVATIALYLRIGARKSGGLA